MKHITFNYTKADGSTSERELLALVSPGGDKYAGIDMTLLDPIQASTFVSKAKELHDNYLEQLKELQAEFDLKHNYRQFFASNMSDISELK